MNFVDQTGGSSGWTMGFDRDGRELIVVAIKATFTLPLEGEPAQRSPLQLPLTTSDAFTGEPGASAPLYEVDFAHRKSACDVLLNGRAYAPEGRLADTVPVAMKVGSMLKAFHAVGHRTWQGGLFGLSPGTPEPFDAVTLSYDNAFGGVDTGDGDEPPRTYAANPVGRGYRPSKRGLKQQAMPNTQEIERPIDDPAGHYRPMSFGAIGRNWQPRAAFAGTYDQQWIEQRAPFWPANFDDRYFQAAPQDQQIPHPTGGEEVVLRNLSPQAHIAFRLPAFCPKVLFVPHRGPILEMRAMTDTLLFEPDHHRFCMTARVAMAMRRSCFDLQTIVAGASMRDWLGERRFGSKPYYKNLAELVAARRRTRP